MSEETQVYKILPHDFQPAASKISEWCVTIRPGVPFDVIKDKPEAWGHNVKKLKPGNIIHIETTDQAYYARVYVLAVHKSAAKVHVLEYVQFAASVELPKAYRVEWGGGHKWRVIRISDRAVIEHGFQNEADAADYANDLVKKLAA